VTTVRTTIFSSHCLSVATAALSPADIAAPVRPFEQMEKHGSDPCRVQSVDVAAKNKDDRYGNPMIF